MKIKFIRNTFLKRSTLKHGKVIDTGEHFEVGENNQFELQWIKSVNLFYCQVSLKKPINGLHEWFVHKPDLDLSSIPPNIRIGLDANIETINLNVPYLSCGIEPVIPGIYSLTCIAMCLNYFGIPKKTKIRQYEEELYTFAKANNLDINLQTDLVKIFRGYGVRDIFDADTSYKKIKAHLLMGNPVIISGGFTGGGTSIVLRGCDRRGYFANDPHGEWFTSGYKAQSGENLHYASSLIFSTIHGHSASCWAHLPSLINGYRSS